MIAPSPRYKERMALPLTDTTEWLEADGAGGFALGTTTLTRTRRYHALLCTAITPPTRRVVLVNGFDAWIETDRGRYAISSQRWASGELAPDGAKRIEFFGCDPWPRWVFALEDGTRVEQEIFVRKGEGVTVVTWRVIEGNSKAALVVRPYLSGRDYHGTHHRNGVLSFDAKVAGERVDWRTYGSLPGVASFSNGEYTHEPYWYEKFFYAEEAARGQECVEDLATPGTLRFDLASGEAVWIVGTDRAIDALESNDRKVANAARRLRGAEKRRRARFESVLERSADAYFVQRGSGSTIVAGYPWFTDWGRDTFISLRGLALATGRYADARSILCEWAKVVSEGMVPNRFTECSESPDYNSVDASLWFAIAAGEFLEIADRTKLALPRGSREALVESIEAILDGYARGTRFGIRLDDDHLLAAGVPGVQLTWMDAKVDGRVITPRVGKPVEVQALWINALKLASRHAPRFRTAFQRGLESFVRRFWNAEHGALYDVVDVDHVHGACDATIRPNQIFAVGGLPLALISGARAESVVDLVEKKLWTPRGLRTLAADEPNYCGRYVGGLVERDQCYHQGTAWPWLNGAFVEAWVRVHGDDGDARREARERFVRPLIDHLEEAGVGHVSEIADGDEPHTPRGAPFQAWSIAELLRLERSVLAT